MALITGSANASVVGPVDTQLVGFRAGEALKNAAFVFIASDGDIEESDINSGSVTCGVVSGPYGGTIASGQAVTIYSTDTRIGNYSSGMTPGTVLYLSGTDPGSLEDAATVADTKGVALVVSATDIVVKRTDSQKRGEGF